MLEHNEFLPFTSPTYVAENGHPVITVTTAPHPSGSEQRWTRDKPPATQSLTGLPPALATDITEAAAIMQNTPDQVTHKSPFDQ